MKSLKPKGEISKGSVVNHISKGLCRIKSIWWTQIIVDDELWPTPVITMVQLKGGKKYRTKTFKGMELVG